MKTILRNSNPYHFLIILVLFLAVNAWVWNQYGIKVMTDSDRYLRWSIEIWQGKLNLYMLWYSGYVIFLSLCLKLGIGLTGVVVLQMIFSLIACVSIYLLTSSFTSRGIYSLIASIGYLLFIEISHWNVYILTESLFTSCVVILITLFSFNKRVEKLWWLLPLLIFTVFIRPMGITVLLALLVWLYYRYEFHRSLSKKKKILLFSGILMFSLSMMVLLLEGNPGVQFFYSQGQVVWGADQVVHLSKNPWMVVDNSDISFQAETSSSTLVFLQFAAENFLYLMELFMKKAMLFLVHVKPYYSWQHNSFIAVFLFPLYGASVYGLVKTRVDGIKQFVISFFLLNMAMTGLTVEAWDGRFLIPCIPLLLIMAAVGLDQLITHKFSINKTKKQLD